MTSFKNGNIVSIAILGIFIHVLLLLAVFDTYFKSPLEHGMSSVLSTKNPASKRLVLFVADGLRAEAILGENEDRVKFLTSIRKHRGSWGVSHTRVPTESRPGHVAMLAGIYEDPSAIFKGWKHNPVDFDSVINQSRNAWCIGSPDIVPIFNKDERKHVHVFSYDSEMQDFGNKDTITLDKWVFNKTDWVLKHLKDSEVFQQAGNVFFLHLLGMDTVGHAFKPNSKEYFDNLFYIDENIKIMEEKFNEAFPDKLTSFVMTSDHGMTNWGSHGSGLEHETFTPIIVWGAGVKIDGERKDIQQIDVAPLISSLIGLNYPVNSLGRLPHGYLNDSDKTKLDKMLNNILQVFHIFIEKQRRIEQSTLYYKPYKYMNSEDFYEDLSQLWSASDNFKVVIRKSERLFEEILKAIDYYHNYFMKYILFSVSLGLFLWIVYLSTHIFTNGCQIEQEKDYVFVLKMFSISYIILVVIMCYFQSFPFLYYLYFLLPGFMFLFLVSKCYRNLNFQVILHSAKSYYLMFFICCIGIFIYGFQYRFCFSLMMVLNSVSIFLNSKCVKRISWFLRMSWIVFSLILSVFPLLPLMFTKFQVFYFSLGFLAWQSFSYFSCCNSFFVAYFNLSLTSLQKLIFRFQKIMNNLSFLNSLIISLDIFSNSFVFKYVSWVLFLVSLLTIPVSMRRLEVRILTIIQAFAPFYIMTTMSYELIFLAVFCVFLVLWMMIEQSFKLGVELESFRKCLIFITMILIGFFGTGNIASLNSFDPMWVRCFLTVFSPFKMTALIVVKLLIPFLYTGCVFRNIVLKTGMDLTSSFCSILFISDIMVFYFMYQIKNVGSWLEIGMSLSHFIVVECFTLGILVLYFVSFVFTNIEVSRSFLKRVTGLKY